MSASPSPEQKPAARAVAAPAPSQGGREKLIWAAFSILLFANYLPTLKWMVQRWDEPESYMSHGWLIPFISAWLLWRERPAVARAFAATRGSASGWFLIAPALLLHLVAGLADVSSISGLTLVPLLLGFVALRFGWGMARAVWFPVVFLTFMVPPPEFIISGMNFRLKLMAADLAAVVLNSTGLPAVRSGSFMLFGNEKLAIGDVCSGLRSLLSLFSIGVLYAWLIRPKGRAHVLAVLAATAPAAIVGNGLRIGLVSYLVYWLGQAVVFKPLIGSWDLHLFTGAFIFVGALGILAGVGTLVDLLASRSGGGK